MNRIFLFIPLLVIITISCGKDNGTPPQNPSLSEFNVQSNHIRTDSMTVSVFVSDPQGSSDIDSVWGAYGYLDGSLNSSLLLYDDGTHGDSSSGDSRYSIRFAPAGGTFDLGYYRVQVSAVDMSGNTSGSLEDTFWTIDGVGPILFDIVAPDSIQRGSQTPSYVTIRAYDVDGLADIDSVYIITTRPDSSSSGSHFHMSDDGHTYDDAVANDGRFTFAMVADLSNQAGGYTFTFYAYDAAEHASNNPSVIITLY